MLNIVDDNDGDGDDDNDDQDDDDNNEDDDNDNDNINDITPRKFLWRTVRVTSAVLPWLGMLLWEGRCNNQHSNHFDCS